MKNKNQRQRIFDLIKKCLFLSLATLIVIANMTACDIFNGPVSSTTNEHGYNETDFGDLLDPTKPLTPEQIEKSEISKNYLSSFEHNFKENGIRAIQITKPLNSTPLSLYNAEISYDDSFLHGLNIKVDKKTCEALIKLSDNCKANEITGIDKIKYEERLLGESEYLYITITFNEHGNNIIQKYLTILQPFVPDVKDTYIEGVETITDAQEKIILDYLSQYWSSFKYGIASVDVIENTTTTDQNQKYSLNIKADVGNYRLNISEEQYNRFNKYLKFKDLYSEKTSTNTNKDNLKTKSFYLSWNSEISDTLKDQIYHEVYEIFEEAQLINSNILKIEQ